MTQPSPARSLPANTAPCPSWSKNTTSSGTVTECLHVQLMWSFKDLHSVLTRLFCCVFHRDCNERCSLKYQLIENLS